MSAIDNEKVNKERAIAQIASSGIPDIKNIEKLLIQRREACLMALNNGGYESIKERFEYEYEHINRLLKEYLLIP